jgi:hypothetical protein
MTMAKRDSTDADLVKRTSSAKYLLWLKRTLERRYPQTTVRVEWLDQPEYKGWWLTFEAETFEPLLRIPHFPRELCADEAQRYRGAYPHPICRDELGIPGTGPYGPDGRVSAGIHIPHPRVSERRPSRALTKKMERQVAKLLRPFIAGTWQSNEAHKEG